MSDTTHPAKRDEKGRLLPGHGMGRPRGTSLIEHFRAYIEPHWDGIKDAMIAAAKGGDTKAAEFIAQRMVPPSRPQAERVVVPGLAEAPDLKGKAEAVTRAVASGQISAEAGRQVLAMLADAARILQVDDLDKRVRRLEGKPPRTIDVQPGEEDLL